MNIEINERPSFSVFEPIPLLTTKHWRPVYDFVEAISPNNALVDVKILPFSTYKPTLTMLENGYVDNDGMQHVFVSCMKGFEDEIDGRKDFNVRRSSLTDIFSRSRRGDIELVNLWCEFTNAETKPHAMIDYLIYRYQSGALDFLDAMNGNTEKHILDARSEGVHKKAMILREWLSKPKSQINNYRHVRDIASGIMTEIWMTDFLNYNLTKIDLDNYRFVIAPQELDASIPGESSGGDILVLRRSESSELPIALLDAKLERGTRRVPNSGYNRRSDSPKVSFPIGDVLFDYNGMEQPARHFIYYLAQNIQIYDESRPFALMDDKAVTKVTEDLLNKFLMFISNARMKFKARFLIPPDEDDSEFLGTEIQKQIQKIDELENIIHRMITFS